MDKNEELKTHRAEHTPDAFQDDCIFCVAADDDNQEQGMAKAYISIVGENYANWEDAEDAYQGEYSNDEDFARETAESLGEMPKDNQWPMYCIDWEWAARELMVDHTEENGHYFRA